MIEMGFVVALGLLVTFCKVGWKKRLWMLSHPLIMDVSVFVLLTAVHWGTYSGVMVATVGAVTCSLALSFGKWLFGYIMNGKYVPGRFIVKGM